MTPDPVKVEKHQKVELPHLLCQGFLILTSSVIEADDAKTVEPGIFPHLPGNCGKGDFGIRTVDHHQFREVIVESLLHPVLSGNYPHRVTKILAAILERFPDFPKNFLFTVYQGDESHFSSLHTSCSIQISTMSESTLPLSASSLKMASTFSRGTARL